MGPWTGVLSAQAPGGGVASGIRVSGNLSYNVEYCVAVYSKKAQTTTPRVRAKKQTKELSEGEAFKTTGN